MQAALLLNPSASYIRVEFGFSFTIVKMLELTINTTYKNTPIFLTKRELKNKLFDTNTMLIYEKKKAS